MSAQRQLDAKFPSGDVTTTASAAQLRARPALSEHRPRQDQSAESTDAHHDGNSLVQPTGSIASRSPHRSTLYGWSKATAGFDEQIRRLGVELEHVVVAGNHEPCADVVGQLRGLVAEQIAGNATFRAIAVDRQERHVDRKRPQQLGHARVAERVAAVDTRSCPPSRTT